MKISFQYDAHWLMLQHKFQVGNTLFDVSRFGRFGFNIGNPRYVFTRGDLVGYLFQWKEGTFTSESIHNGTVLFSDNEFVDLVSNEMDLIDVKGRVIRLHFLQDFNAEEKIANNYDDRRRCQEDRKYNGIPGIFIG